MSITVREAVFALWRDLGLNTIFGNPGSTELPMFRDFPDDFRYVLALQESVAVAMADGFAQSRAQGVQAVQVSRCEDVDPALRTAFAATGPVLVDACMQDHG